MKLIMTILLCSLSRWKTHVFICFLLLFVNLTEDTRLFLSRDVVLFRMHITNITCQYLLAATAARKVLNRPLPSLYAHTGLFHFFVVVQTPQYHRGRSITYAFGNTNVRISIVLHNCRRYERARARILKRVETCKRDRTTAYHPRTTVLTLFCDLLRFVRVNANRYLAYRVFVIITLIPIEDRCFVFF